MSAALSDHTSSRRVRSTATIGADMAQTTAPDGTEEVASPVDANPADGEFPTTAVYRQPADALGPRAQRTIARILEATREVFLTRGYAGTTIDEIARAADVSRASFYTYFPSKREVLLAVGARSASDALAIIERIPTEGASSAGLGEWVTEYFQQLDVNGAFAFAWTQAAYEDDTIRSIGMRAHLALCKRFGEVLAQSAGTTRTDTVELGLVAFSLLERAWSYWYLYGDNVDRSAIEATAAQSLWAAARGVPAGADSPG